MHKSFLTQLKYLPEYLYIMRASPAFSVIQQDFHQDNQCHEALPGDAKVVRLRRGREGREALPHTPFKELFEKSSLRTFKNFQRVKFSHSLVESADSGKSFPPVNKDKFRTHPAPDTSGSGTRRANVSSNHVSDFCLFLLSYGCSHRAFPLGDEGKVASNLG